MTVDQVLVAAAPHDAVTNHALSLREALRTRGPSTIYARHVAPEMAERGVRPLPEFGAAPRRAIVLHASIGEPELAAFLAERPEPIVLVYHNITPAEWFEPYDPRFAGLLRAGREELVALRERVVAAVADSTFNAGELEALGYQRVAVEPPLPPAGRLADAPDDPAAAAHLAGDGPIHLAVGQLLPHKRPDFLLRAFHVLKTYLDPSARLVLAGAARLEPYARALQQFARELALPDVWFAGAVSDPALATSFRRASTFVTASEHEGFCVPLIEAMDLGVPIVARRFGAVPETLGEAGVLLSPDDGPLVFAEAMHRAGADRSLADELRRRGRRRADAVAAEAPGRQLLAVLEGVGEGVGA